MLNLNRSRRDEWSWRKWKMLRSNFNRAIFCTFLTPIMYLFDNAGLFWMAEWQRWRGDAVRRSQGTCGPAGRVQNWWVQKLCLFVFLELRSRRWWIGLLWHERNRNWFLFSGIVQCALKITMLLIQKTYYKTNINNIRLTQIFMFLLLHV